MTWRISSWSWPSGAMMTRSIRSAAMKRVRSSDRLRVPAAGHLGSAASAERSATRAHTAALTPGEPSSLLGHALGIVDVADDDAALSRAHRRDGSPRYQSTDSEQHKRQQEKGEHLRPGEVPLQQRGLGEPDRERAEHRQIQQRRQFVDRRLAHHVLVAVVQSDRLCRDEHQRHESGRSRGAGARPNLRGPSTRRSRALRPMPARRSGPEPGATRCGG